MARGLVKVDRLINLAIIHLLCITLLIAHTTITIVSIKVRIIGLILIKDTQFLLQLQEASLPIQGQVQTPLLRVGIGGCSTSLLNQLLKLLDI